MDDGWMNWWIDILFVSSVGRWDDKSERFCAKESPYPFPASKMFDCKMDNLQFYVLFNSVSIISGSWELDYERLFAMKPSLGLERFPSIAQIEPRTTILASSSALRHKLPSYWPFPDGLSVTASFLWHERACDCKWAVQCCRLYFVLVSSLGAVLQIRRVNTDTDHHRHKKLIKCSVIRTVSPGQF